MGCQRSAGFQLLLVSMGILIHLSPAEAAPRNVVLFVTDDHSPDTGEYGNRVIRTPHLDSLARDGTLFTNAFCTTASCSASRSVILSGLHNHANGQFGHQHDYHKFSSFANIGSLPVYLEEAGYRTARCGKFHVAPDAVYRFQQVIPGPERNPVQMANNCREFLAAQDERPFFLYICTADPHRGGGVANELEHQPDRFGNPAPGKSYPGVTEVKYDPREVVVPGFLPDTPACRAELAQYYQSVSRVDQGIGRLVEILKQAGHWDDTLFLFISDHGIAMPGAKTTLYDGGMRSPCLVRDPYHAQRGVRCQALVSWVDLVPTILDFAGAYDPREQSVRADIVERLRRRDLPADAQQTRASPAGKLHGRSFLALLDQDQPAGWDEVYASHTFHEIQMYYPMRVVRTRRFKLIWNIAHPLPFPFASDLWAAPTWQAQYRQGLDAPYGARTVRSYLQRPRFELYDLEADPHEARNLADEPQWAQVRDELVGKLRDFQRRTNDPWILKWEYE